MRELTTREFGELAAKLAETYGVHRFETGAIMLATIDAMKATV